MQADNFLETRTRHPLTLGVAVAVHAAALAALMLAKPAIFDPPPGAIDLIDPTLPKPPPEPVPPLKERLEPKSSIDRPIPRAPAPPEADDVDFTPGPASVFEDLGSGGGTIIEPIRIVPDPVFVDPRPDPRFARDLQPPYPPGLQRLEIEGAVTVRVLVGADGRVLRIEAVQADHDGFLKSTRDWAVRHWRFRPGTRDGVPVEAWRTMTVRFRIDR